MQKIIRLLMALILILILFLGFLMLRGCNQAAPTADVNLAATVSQAAASATPTSTPLVSVGSVGSPTPSGSANTAEHDLWTDPPTMIMGNRGTTVAQVQDRLRALGYFNYKSSGYFVSMTKQALLSFQTANGLMVDGLIGQTTINTLFSAGAKRAAVTAPAPAASPPPTVKPREQGELMAWSDVNGLIPASGKILVIDYSSQLYFYAVRAGGVNHMEIEPETAADAAKFLAIFSGQTSYEKRACVVQFGEKFLAASLCGMPHGAKTVSGNSLNGQLCLYFSQSTAEDLPVPDAQHNANILKASGQ